MNIKDLFGKGACVLGILGILVCLAAVAGRFYGAPSFLGFSAINVFIVGVGLISTACWAKLESK